MVKYLVLRKSLIAASTLAALLPWTVQASTIVAQASSTLSNLNYHLIDLDSSDGIAPSVTFNSHVGGPTMVYNGPSIVLGGEEASSSDIRGTDKYIIVKATPFSSSSGTLTLSSTASTASKTTRQIQANALLTSDDVASNLQLAHQSFDRTLSASSSDLSWTLSAHTAIVFDGSLTLNSTVDASSLLGTEVVQNLFAQQLNLSVLARSTAIIELGTGYYFLSPDGPQSIQSPLVIESQFVTPAGIQQRSNVADVAAPFSLRFSNTTAQSVTHTLEYSVESLVTMTTFTPVPEPRTVVLQTLGLLTLVGLSVAKRRRHAQA